MLYAKPKTAELLEILGIYVWIILEYILEKWWIIYIHWIHLILGRAQYRALLNSEINLRGSNKGEEFLDHLQFLGEDVSLSKLIVIRLKKVNENAQTSY
jgi:hypothetical protein